jgi:hypothetical protein
LIIGVLSPIVFAFKAYSAIGNFTLEYKPNPADFKTADESFLANIAHEFDYRYAKYHLPLNQSSSTHFNNDSEWNGGNISYTNVSRYSFSDNEALWTGIDFTGWTYKYLVAKQTQNTMMEQFALEVLINMTTSLSLMMAVPNGGLGPEYGGVLARGYAPPDAQDIWPYIFTDQPKHFNGTGPYSQWRYRAYTSNDEYGGYYLFLSIATKYLQDIPFIKDRVSLIVDQICSNWLYTNFLGIHGSGATTGVDQKPRAFSGGFWGPLIFKLGAIYHPAKYERIYYHFVASDMYYFSNAEGGAQENFANYYAFNFGYCVVFGFLLIEDPTSPVWKHYYNGFIDSLWKYTYTHRNAWYNAIYLMIHKETNKTKPVLVESQDFVAKDIKDQLQRYAEAHSPDLLYSVNITLPEGYKIIKPVQNFANSLGLDAHTQRLLGISGEEEFLNRPMTIDMYSFGGWPWNDNPFSWDPIQKGNILIENPGTGFTVPYWMIRFCGYIQGGML